MVARIVVGLRLPTANDDSRIQWTAADGHVGGGVTVRLPNVIAHVRTWVAMVGSSASSPTKFNRLLLLCGGGVSEDQRERAGCGGKTSHGEPSQEPLARGTMAGCQCVSTYKRGAHYNRSRAETHRTPFRSGHDPGQPRLFVVPLRDRAGRRLLLVDAKRIETDACALDKWIGRGVEAAKTSRRPSRR